MSEYRIVDSKEIVFLPSKINVPSLNSKIIFRKDLLNTFEETLNLPLTTVISSAGFGKTTAVLSWVKSLKEIPVAWFLLDGEDSALDRFWLYFTAALRIADKDICHAYDAVGLSDDFTSMRSLIDILLLQMSEYEKDIVCVLEDFHTVHDDEAIHESMQYFLKHLPVNVHIVITSRQQLHLPVLKMKVAGLLNEVTEFDLRFTSQETEQFFDQMGIKLTKEEHALVYEFSQGWPTGCKLIALLCGSGTKAEITKAMSLAKSTINEYLFKEVYSVLSSQRQDFLLSTAVVSSFCLSLVERITGLSQKEASGLIEWLIESDLFIERIERKGDEWYRYHLLFSDMLEQRLSLMDRQRVEVMRRSARDWFAEQGFLDYVVEISADLKDYERIKELIADNWQAMYRSDNHATLRRWASFLPEQVVLESPLLSAVLTLPYGVKGDFEKSTLYLQNALDSLKGEKDYLYALCAAQEAYMYSFKGDIEQMNACAAEALRYFPQDEFYLRGMMAQIQAASWMETRPFLSKEAFTRALDVQGAYGDRGLLASAYCNLSLICAVIGQLEEAQYYIDLALDLYDEQERRFKPMLSFAYASLMVLEYEKEDMTGALVAYESFAVAAGEGILYFQSALAEAMKAKALYRLRSAEGKQCFFKALEIDESGALLSYPSLSMVEDYCNTFTSQALTRLQVRSERPQVRLFGYSVAFCLDVVTAYEDLCEYCETISEEGRLAKLYALIVAAVFSYKVARYNRAEYYLEEALGFSQKVSIRQPLFENKSYLLPILERLKVAKPGLFKGDLLNLIEERDEVHETQLTDREQEVMRLIAAGRTIPQTAEALFVSRDTIKKHLSHVYAKLGVHSKLQAVNALREKDLL